jgi:hypothetical protein
MGIKTGKIATDITQFTPILNQCLREKIGRLASLFWAPWH